MKIKLKLVKNAIMKRFKEAEKADAIRRIVRATAVSVGSEAREIIREKDIIDNGTLLNSIQTRKVRLDTFEFTVGNLPITFYGKFHEFGTRYMKARPFLAPAAEFGRKKLVDRLKRYAKKFGT